MTRPLPFGEPPPRPDFLRAEFERQSRPSTLGYRLAFAMFFTPFVLFPLVLFLFSESATGRVVAAVWTAMLLVSFLITWWTRRPAARFQERALAASEAFWSQPDAEQVAREMRLRNARFLARLALVGHPFAKELVTRADKKPRTTQK